MMWDLSIVSPSDFWKAETALGEGGAPGAPEGLCWQKQTHGKFLCFWHIGNKKAEYIYTEVSCQ